jgi:hypothetical protein
MEEMRIPSLRILLPFARPGPRGVADNIDRPIATGRVTG